MLRLEEKMSTFNYFGESYSVFGALILNRDLWSVVSEFQPVVT